MWLKGLLGELLGKEIDTTLKCDKQSAIHLARNQAHHERTKHIDVHLHFIKEILDKKGAKARKSGRRRQCNRHVHQSCSSSQDEVLHEEV